MSEKSVFVLHPINYEYLPTTQSGQFLIIPVFFTCKAAILSVTFHRRAG